MTSSSYPRFEMNEVCAKRNVWILCIVVVALMIAKLIADTAFPSESGGTLVTHDNGDGTHNFVYYSGATISIQTREYGQNFISTESLNSVKGDHGVSPNQQGTPAADGTGTWSEA